MAEILKKCDDYCERLSHSKISFSCKEKVIEEKYHHRFILDFNQSLRFTTKKEKNTYVYDYLFHVEENRIDAKRILLEENGFEKFEEDAELKIEQLKGIHLLLEPIGLLSENAHKYFNYQVIAEKAIYGEEAIIIQAISQQNQEEKSLRAKIWVRACDGAPLKIEWDQKESGYFLKIEKIEKKFPDSHYLKLILEMMIEKKGIRFPTKCSINEGYRSSSIKQNIPRASITILYDNYEF